MAVITLKRAIRQMAKTPEMLDDALRGGVEAIAKRAVFNAKYKFIVPGGPDPYEDPPNNPPGPLKNRTGSLRKSLHVVGPTRKGDGIFSAGIDSDHPAARAHEFGVTTKPHIIAPRNAKVLRFRAGPPMFENDPPEGTFVFRNFVNHPGSVIPPRPFIAPAIKMTRASVILNARVKRALKGKK
jgi:hypothetical protein